MDEIIHDKENTQFYIKTNNLKSELDYTLHDSTIIAHHTFVPEELRGKKIAERLVLALIDYAEKNQLKINPTCSYIDSYFQKNQNKYASIRV